MKSNPIIDSLWAPFNKKMAKTLRMHRSKFLPEDEFNCDVLAKVVRPAIEDPEVGIPVGVVVNVIQVGPPQVSSQPIWRTMKRPYVDALVEDGDRERHCNLESLEPI